MKALAKNKTAQTIAKTAACTMVPGGSLVVSAIDAKQNKSVAGAANVAASAAAGVPGSSCPGMGGLGGLTGMGKMGAAMSGVPGAGKGGGLAGLAGAATGMPPGTTVSTSLGSVATMAAQMQAASAQMQNASAGNALQTEAAGKQMELSGDPVKDLSKGKLVIKKVDWILHTAALSAASTQTFADIMTSIGAAIKQAGGSYHVDVYMDKHYADGEATSLGAQRVSVVLAMLQGAQVGDAVQAGKTQKDKEQRIEIVKNK